MQVNLTGVVLTDPSGATVAEQQTMAVPQGSNVTISLTVKKSDGTAKDLTGGAVRFRADREDGTEIVDIAGTLTTPASGLAAFTISTELTADVPTQIGRYSVWWTSSGGEPEQIIPSSEFWVLDAVVDLGDPVSSPGPSMLLVGVPVPDAGDVGKVLSVTDDDPATLDWATAGAGTVTSVATGTGLSGGPITGSGTISLANTAVTPGSYTAADITVDAQGRITAAASGAGGASSLQDAYDGGAEVVIAADPILNTRNAIGTGSDPAIKLRNTTTPDITDRVQRSPSLEVEGKITAAATEGLIKRVGYRIQARQTDLSWAPGYHQSGDLELASLIDDVVSGRLIVHDCEASMGAGVMAVGVPGGPGVGFYPPSGGLVQFYTSVESGAPAAYLSATVFLPYNGNSIDLGAYNLPWQGSHARNRYSQLLAVATASDELHMDPTAGVRGDVIEVTMGHNVTAWSLAHEPTGKPGQIVTIVFVQPAVGGPFTLAGAAADIKLASALTLSVAADARDTLVLLDDGVNWIELNRSLGN